MEIKNQLYKISDEFNLFDDIEIINVALVLFSILCDTHANADLERHFNYRRYVRRKNGVYTLR